jgi:DNA helicase HerA-like ATPase
MATAEDLQKAIAEGYTFKGESIILGTAMFNKQAVPETLIRIPLNVVNRHGLVAGATGTGKTKTIQQFAESLSENGIPVLLMDIKGDLSGIAKPGTENPKITDRQKLIGKEWKPEQFPVELMSISSEKGLRLRATVSEFGPVLFSKILELNDNQQGAVAIVFKYCDDKRLPLLDIKDFRQALQYVTDDAKGELKAYGQISPATAGVIMRKLLELEQQGADKFFGEKSFEVEDLIRKHKDGRGYINVIRLGDMQDKPKLFSTFMLCLLAEVYQKFPELGDKAAPKLVIFIDEAHLIFREATKTLMDQLETVIKLIRSKGVGIFFCTQIPGDIPDAILSQLGSKFQHAMRAFTAKDRKDIKLVAENYPSTKFYDTDTLLTELGIGEAIVTVLDEKGAPTPLAHTLLCAPRTRMDVLTPDEQDQIVASSEIAREYNEVIDRESAYEMLNKKINAVDEEDKNEDEPQEKSGKKQSGGIADTISAVTNNPIVKQVARELTRSVFGMLFGKSTTTRRRR